MSTHRPVASALGLFVVSVFVHAGCGADDATVTTPDLDASSGADGATGDAAVDGVSSIDGSSVDSAADASFDGALLDGPAPEAGSDADIDATPNCTMGCLPNTWNLDGNPATGVCGCEYSCTQTSPTNDSIDPNFIDDNCDGTDGVVAKCVFVAASQGDDVNGVGTRQNPLKTIGAAIQYANTHALSGVCVSGETYAEAVQVVSGISIYGGFNANDPVFKFRRSANVTTSVSAQGTVFAAPQINIETHLEGLTIDALPTMTSGASIYGVRLGSGAGALYVRYDILQIATGNDGVSGAAGVAFPQPQAPSGIVGQGGCNACFGMGAGGPQPACIEFGGKGGNGGFDSSPGETGSPGSGGAGGGSPGVATGLCMSRSGVGGPGTVGAVGAQGTVGTGGASIGIVSALLYSPSAGASGGNGTNAKGGGGGGGGGGGAASIFCNADRGGGGGSGGCGGLGGFAGAGGAGGGGSFGVFAAGGNVIVTACQITTQAGGKGGKGGDGAAGQIGGLGVSGGLPADDSGGGGAGNQGGAGGAGGPAGGGGGGPSACLAHAASATVTFTQNTCVLGAAGVGGAGGTNPRGATAPAGQTGLAMANVQIN